MLMLTTFIMATKMAAIIVIIRALIATITVGPSAFPAEDGAVAGRRSPCRGEHAPTMSPMEPGLLLQRLRRALVLPLIPRPAEVPSAAMPPRYSCRNETGSTRKNRITRPSRMAFHEELERLPRAANKSHREVPRERNIFQGPNGLTRSSKDISQRPSTSRTEIPEDILANGVQDVHA